ncbi:hypothetical protein LTR08_005099 [Meristemomyces frigidus]|nr:hypothetical protein LTR08_005099 [Meristemomyces frigidus]
MKRKSDQANVSASNGNGPRNKKPATAATGLRDRFGTGLFEPTTVKKYATSYATSEPYKHAVVSDLINDSLLRAVRKEILSNIHFTPKETDIYKIHQSGDLANLDGLDPAALEKLPSLLKLRDALYGEEFRRWIEKVSGAGAVSGVKTDMAVNVYVPGCHLLCHDDVIGSRRVSYILYLTDPDKPWKAEWGGALRLYSTDSLEDVDGKVFKVPRAEWSKVIPPAWNQLSFFAVQPGESFHDVEEVYKRALGDSEDDGGRMRMAISGWFHIPQEGEAGFEPGLEQRMAEKSSLQQLQGKADQFDEPQSVWFDPAAHEDGTDGGDDEDLTEKDLEFLLEYMTPNYLTPETVDELCELFAEESTLQLSNFLSKKFALRLREQFERCPDGIPTTREFGTSRPPHKHRFQYLHPAKPSTPNDGEGVATANPYEQLLDDFLPSLPFRKWLALATGLTLTRSSVLARRFRRSLDYQLAQGFEGRDPQLEYTLSITPTAGWGADEGEDGGDGDGAADDEGDNVGGYELYMAGAEEDDEASETGSVDIPAAVSQSATGAGNRRQSRKADPAVYQAAAAEDEDDGILFSNPASWNTLSVVLRDRGTLRFVKYVSRQAGGDRWDFTGGVGVEGGGEEGDGDDGEEEEEWEGCGE